MAVYVVQAGEGSPVKIGTTNRLLNRMATLQRDSAAPLRIVRLFEGGFRDEKELHLRFAQHRLQGEWFAPADEIISGEVHLPTLDIPIAFTGKQYRTSDNGCPLSAYLKSSGLSQREFSSRSGIPVSTLSGIQSGARAPSIGMLSDIWTATNGAVCPNDIVAWWASSREAAP